MLLCAQYILPITSEPFQDGAVLVRDGRIADIGSASLLKLRYPDEEVRDFGSAAILPGMIDLHSHLENSVMRGIVHDGPYTEWMQSISETAARLDAHDWEASSILGGLEALSSGVTFIADVSTTGAPCAALNDLGLRGIVYREVGVVDEYRVDGAIDIAHNDILSWASRVDSDRITIGIAPCEPYACHPKVFQRAAELARTEDIPLSLNIAGSREEYDFIRYGASSLSVDRMAYRRGFIEMPPWLPTGVTPVNYVLNWGGFEADNVVAAHCVHIKGEDIRKLREYGVSVAACPRCDAQLSMGVTPVTRLTRSGIHVGLGTGYSVATDSTDILSEMFTGMLLLRAVSSGHFVDATKMLEMGTIGAAQALKIDDKIGSLDIGKYADIVAVDFANSHQTPTGDPASVLVNTCTASDVVMTMIDGKIRYEKDQWHVGIEVARAIAHVIEIRGKLR